MPARGLSRRALAEQPLQGGVDEDPIDRRIGSRHPDQRDGVRAPDGRGLVRGQIDGHRRKQPFAIGGRQVASANPRRRRVTDVDVQPRLVAAVTGRRRTAARLRQVAHDDQTQVGAPRPLPQPADEVDERRVTVVAIASEVQHLVAGPGRGQRRRPLQAARADASNRARLARRARLLRPPLLRRRGDRATAAAAGLASPSGAGLVASRRAASRTRAGATTAQA